MASAKTISDILIAGISSGEYPSGAPLPTRHELMTRYAASRSTADKAISILIASGHARAVRGSGTFVSGSAAASPTHAWFVMNSGKLSPSSPDDMSDIFAELRQRLDYSVILASEIESRRATVAGHQASLLVWSRPTLESFAHIAYFASAGIPQFLLNRIHPQHSYASTDNRKGIAEMLSRLAAAGGRPPLGLIAPALDPSMPWLAEREIHFLELAAAGGWQIDRLVRVAEPGETAAIAAVREYFAADSTPPCLFTPDSGLVPTVLAIATERGLLGGGLTLLLCDHRSDLAGIPGILALQQDWPGIHRAALAWLLGGGGRREQKLIAPQVIHQR